MYSQASIQFLLAKEEWLHFVTKKGKYEVQPKNMFSNKDFEDGHFCLLLVLIVIINAISL